MSTGGSQRTALPPQRPGGQAPVRRWAAPALAALVAGAASLPLGCAPRQAGRWSHRGSGYHPLPGLPAAATGTKRASSRAPRPPLPGAWAAPGLSQRTVWLLEIPSCHCLPPTVGSPPTGSPSRPPGRGPSAQGGPAPRAGQQEAPTPGAKEATTRPCSLLKGSPSPLLPAPTPPLPASAPALTSCCPGWPPPDLTVLSPGRQAPSAPSDSPRPRPAPSSRWGTARPLPWPAPFSVVTLPARPPPPSPTPKIKARCHHHRPGAVSPPAVALLPGSPG